MKRARFAARIATAALCAAASAPAGALPPDQVFEKVAPSVWAVRGLNAAGRPFSFGSGVVIAHGRLITNCHVLAKAKSIRVARANVSYGARLESADAERDLCIVSVANFDAPAVVTVRHADLKVGQRVYAIGNPINLELTLSEGLISGLRSEIPSLPPIQTSAPISPGSSGGGLFDDKGRLVGITTLIVLGREHIAQNLNFAVPADWIAEVPERAAQQLAKLRGTGSPSASPSSSSPAAAQPSAPQIAGGGALPPIGSHWSYTVRDQGISGATWDFSVVLNAVSGSTVTEMLSTSSGQEPYGFDAKAMAFIVRRMRPDIVLELSPYLLAYTPSPALPLGEPATYAPGVGVNWNIRVDEVAHEQVSIRAGRFDAVRIKVVGENPNVVMLSGNHNKPQRFEYTAWYAPEVGRYVQAHHQVFDVYGVSFSDQWVQLVSFGKAGSPTP